MAVLEYRKFLKFIIILVIIFLLESISGTPQIVEEDVSDEWKPENLGNKEVVESTLVRYYAFSLENPEEFENGEVPEFKEVGPFTYREKRIKKNMQRVQNNELQYDIHWSMSYIPELTGQGLSEDTEMRVVNVPLVTMAEGLSIRGLPKAFSDILIDEILEAGESLSRDGIKFGDSTFHGYNISLYTDILDDITQGQTEERYPELANGKFAFYKNKNNTITANYKVLSTRQSPFGRILEYKGSSQLGFWSPNSLCDDVSGSYDLFTFPPGVKKDREYHIFLPENCRSFKLKFFQEDVFRGIPVYTFKFPLEQFRNSLEGSSSSESCYCTNFGNFSNPMCLDEGLMDYSGCSKGAPFTGSFPHFLHANPKLLTKVKGLSPNKSLHESEIMVEPITGTPLYAVRRFQLNLRLHPISTVTYFQNMTERMIPLAWVEYILEVPSTVFTEVKEKLEKLKKMKDQLLETNELSYRDKYENEPPVTELDDNTLFSGRSGFPGMLEDSQQLEKSNETQGNHGNGEEEEEEHDHHINGSSLAATMKCWLLSYGVATFATLFVWMSGKNM